MNLKLLDKKLYPEKSGIWRWNPVDSDSFCTHWGAPLHGQRCRFRNRKSPEISSSLHSRHSLALLLGGLSDQAPRSSAYFELWGKHFCDIGKFSWTTPHDPLMILLLFSNWGQICCPVGDVLFIVTGMNMAELNIKESTIISHTLLLIDVVTVCWHRLCSVLNVVYW